MNASKEISVKYLLGLVCVLTSACASSKPPAGGPIDQPEEPAPMPGGHTGFENVTWGLTSAELLVTYQATVVGNALEVVGDYHHEPVNVRFELRDDKLVAIELTFHKAFPSMDACGVEWTKLRTHLDSDLGISQSDNLAAYWQNAHRDVTLSCHPKEPEGAALGMHFTPHRAGD